MSTEPRLSAQHEEEPLGNRVMEDLRILFAANMSAKPPSEPTRKNSPIVRTDDFEFVRPAIRLRWTMLKSLRMACLRGLPSQPPLLFIRHQKTFHRVGRQSI